MELPEAIPLNSESPPGRSGLQTMSSLDTSLHRPGNYPQEDARLFSRSHRFSDVFFVDASIVETLCTDLGNISLAKKIGKSAEDTLRSLTSQHQEWLVLVTLNIFHLVLM